VIIVVVAVALIIKYKKEVGLAPVNQRCPSGEFELKKGDDIQKDNVCSDTPGCSGKPCIPDKIKLVDEIVQGQLDRKVLYTCGCYLV